MKTVALHLTIIWGAIGISMADETVVPDAQPVIASQELTAEETKLIELTNIERTKLKLPPLLVDPELMKIARAHSVNMARLDKIGHDLESQTFSDRMQNSGYQALRSGEIVAQGQRIPEQAVADWMRSPAHKANILQSEYTRIGGILPPSSQPVTRPNGGRTPPVHC